MLSGAATGNAPSSQEEESSANATSSNDSSSSDDDDDSTSAEDSRAKDLLSKGKNAKKSVPKAKTAAAKKAEAKAAEEAAAKKKALTNARRAATRKRNAEARKAEAAKKEEELKAAKRAKEAKRAAARDATRAKKAAAQAVQAEADRVERIRQDAERAAAAKKVFEDEMKEMEAVRAQRKKDEMSELMKATDKAVAAGVMDRAEARRISKQRAKRADSNEPGGDGAAERDQQAPNLRIECIQADVVQLGANAHLGKVPKKKTRNPTKRAALKNGKMARRRDPKKRKASKKTRGRCDYSSSSDSAANEVMSLSPSDDSQQDPGDGDKCEQSTDSDAQLNGGNTTQSDYEDEGSPIKRSKATLKDLGFPSEDELDYEDEGERRHRIKKALKKKRKEKEKRERQLKKAQKKARRAAKEGRFIDLSADAFAQEIQRVDGAHFDLNDFAKRLLAMNYKNLAEILCARNRARLAGTAHSEDAIWEKAVLDLSGPEWPRTIFIGLLDYAMRGLLLTESISAHDRYRMFARLHMRGNRFFLMFPQSAQWEMIRRFGARCVGPDTRERLTWALEKSCEETEQLFMRRTEWRKSTHSNAGGASKREKKRKPMGSAIRSDPAAHSQGGRSKRRAVGSGQRPNRDRPQEYGPRPSVPSFLTRIHMPDDPLFTPEDYCAWFHQKGRCTRNDCNRSHDPIPPAVMARAKAEARAAGR